MPRLASEIQQIFASGGVAAVIGPGTRVDREAVGKAFRRLRRNGRLHLPGPKVDETEIAAAAAALKAHGAIMVGLAGHREPRRHRPGSISASNKAMNVVELLRNFLERIAAEAEKSPRPQ